MTPSLILAALLALTDPVPPDVTAVLAAPREARLVFDGRSWTCDATGACVGRGEGVSQPALRECRRFVARLGPVKSWVRDGVALTEAELARCNEAAR